MADSDKISSNSDYVARTACEDLFVDFHRYIDRGEATRALDLFVADGVFEVRGTTYEGRASLAQFLEAREAATDRRTRHLASNFRFVLEGDDLAYASANLTLFTARGEEGPQLALEAVVDCDLTFIRDEDGRWRIKSRRHSRFATSVS